MPVSPIVGPGLSGSRAGKPGQRHRAAGRLRDHVEALVGTVRPIGAEPFDTEVDQRRVDLAQVVVAQPEALQGSQRVVLGEDVHLLDQLQEHRLAALVLEVKRDAALVGVEQDEIKRIDAGALAYRPASLFASAGTLDLDYVGPHPRQQFGARSAGFELGEVENLDACEGLFHGLSSCCCPPES